MKEFFPGVKRADLPAGLGWALEFLTLTTHSGTHLDAPRHFIPNGRTIDEFPLERFMGRARVVHVPARRLMGASDLNPEAFKGASRVLFKTRNSDLWKKEGFDPDFVGLDISAARLLVESGVKLVGIDYLSIEPYHAPGHPVHRFLLSHDMLILEGLNLSRVPEGEYDLICLPLKVVGGEASPVRAVLKGP